MKTRIATHLEVQSLANRIKIVINTLGGTNRAAERIGVSPSTISSYCNGSEPGTFALLKIARTSGVSLDWLASGQEKVIHSPGFLEIPKAVFKDSPQTNKLLCKAGPPMLYLKREIVALTFKDSNPECLMLFRVGDESMRPHLYEREWVIVDTSERTKFDGIYAISIDKIVKFRHILSEGPDTIVIQDSRGFNSRSSYSRTKFLTEIQVLGRTIVSGRYSDIDIDPKALA